MAKSRRLGRPRVAFLAAQQQPDGSFPTTPNAQPAVTSLCVLAFMAHGHNPGNGPYGERLERAVQYIVNCQKPKRADHAAR